MKIIVFAAIILLAACTFTVQETRDPASIAATRTARPIQPLYEGRIKIILQRPPVTIEPQVGVPDWTYTVTPTKASE